MRWTGSRSPGGCARERADAGLTARPVVVADPGAPQEVPSTSKSLKCAPSIAAVSTRPADPSSQSSGAFTQCSPAPPIPPWALPATPPLLVRPQTLVGAEAIPAHSAHWPRATPRGTDARSTAATTSAYRARAVHRPDVLVQVVPLLPRRPTVRAGVRAELVVNDAHVAVEVVAVPKGAGALAARVQAGRAGGALAVAATSDPARAVDLSVEVCAAATGLASTAAAADAVATAAAAAGAATTTADPVRGRRRHCRHPRGSWYVAGAAGKRGHPPRTGCCNDGKGAAAVGLTARRRAAVDARQTQHTGGRGDVAAGTAVTVGATTYGDATEDTSHIAPSGGDRDRHCRLPRCRHHSCWCSGQLAAPVNRRQWRWITGRLRRRSSRGPL